MLFQPHLCIFHHFIAFEVKEPPRELQDLTLGPRIFFGDGRCGIQNKYALWSVSALHFKLAMSGRNQSLALAKLAEQAERYEGALRRKISRAAAPPADHMGRSLDQITIFDPSSVMQRWWRT